MATAPHCCWMGSGPQLCPMSWCNGQVFLRQRVHLAWEFWAGTMSYLSLLSGSYFCKDFGYKVVFWCPSSPEAWDCKEFCYFPCWMCQSQPRAYSWQQTPCHIPDSKLLATHIHVHHSSVTNVAWWREDKHRVYPTATHKYQYLCPGCQNHEQAQIPSRNDVTALAPGERQHQVFSVLFVES